VEFEDRIKSREEVSGHGAQFRRNSFVPQLRITGRVIIPAEFRYDAALAARLKQHWWIRSLVWNLPLDDMGSIISKRIVFE
jgi:hypothetical protein